MRCRKIDDTLVLDLNKDEDNYGQADMPVAMTPDAELRWSRWMESERDEFKEALEMAKTGCMAIHEMQKAALMEKYSAQIEGENNE